jgi:hypothetical protein
MRFDLLDILIASLAQQETTQAPEFEFHDSWIVAKIEMNMHWVGYPTRKLVIIKVYGP